MFTRTDPFKPSICRSQNSYFRECHTVNATVGDLSNTRVLHLVNQIYITENKHLFKDLGSSEPGYLTLKRHNSYARYLG